MIEIFRTLPDINSAVNKHAKFPYTNTLITENINRVIEYHNNNISTINSNHILIRLIQSLGIPYSLSLDRYYDNVDDVAESKASVQKITNILNNGIVHYGEFYGGKTPELLILNEEIIDHNHVYNNWKTYESITVLMHPKTDLRYEIPNGILHSTESGLCVISIHLAALAIQYYAFLRATEYNNLSINHFIKMFVLPNMIKSQTEIVIFNRFYNKVKKLPINNMLKNTHPFPILDTNNLINNIVEQTTTLLMKQNSNYRDVLHTLPSIYRKDMYYDLLIPNYPVTQQTNYVLVLARLKVLDYINTVSTYKNMMQLQQTYNTLQSYSTLNMISKLPLVVLDEVVPYITNVIKTIKK